MTNKNDRFTELDHVGRGAFGEVVVAHDSVLNRHVAIKRYYKKTSELGDVTKSVTHWSKLTHPNIAQVLDYRDQDGSFSVTMTFCSKGELLQLLPELKDDQSGWPAISRRLEVQLPISTLKTWYIVT